MSTRTTLLLLAFVAIASCALAQHAYDVSGDARPRLIFTESSYETLNFTGASDEGLLSCDSTQTSVDIWESIDLDLMIDTVWINVDFNYLSDSFALGIQVFTSSDSLVFCRDFLSSEPTYNFPILNGDDYHVRWYRLDTSSQEAIIETSYSHGNGIVKCPPSPNSMVFGSQSDLDKFAATYPHCDIARGPLEITGDISDLSPLSEIEEVKGPIIISQALNITDLEALDKVTSCQGLILAWNPNLTSIEGLSSLEVINGHFTILWNPRLQHTALPALKAIGKRVFVDGNDSLSNLQFLSGIKHIPEGFTVQSNELLQSLQGAEALESIGGDFLLQNNPNLADCHALQNLDEISGKLTITSLNGPTDLSFLTGLRLVGGQFTLSNSPTLTSLNGLGNLVEVDGGLFITDNPELLSLQGIPSLELLDGPLSITGNQVLGHLSGLSNLREIDGFLHIEDNESLTSLVGLESLDPTSIKSITWNFRDLTIINNPSLTTCHSPTICEANSLPGITALIANNAPGCMSRAEVDSYCSLPVLPVEDWQVTATPHEHGVVIRWTVASEINCDSYSILRRNIDEDWINIFKTSCGQADTYYYDDEITKEGWVDYIMVQTDYDGQTQTSDVIPVYTGDQDGQAPYPNPVLDELFLGQEATYTLYNTMGEPMLSGKGSRVDMTRLPAGIYFLQYGREVHSIVKQ